MGRRSKQYSHCVPRRWSESQYPFADDPQRGMVDMWCGGESRLWDRDKPFESPKLATCIKCAQAIGKAKRAQLEAAGRLRLEAREKPLGYDKSTYDVWIDGTLRAHVGIANGWGEKWYLAKLGDPDDAYARHWTNGRHGGQVSGKVIDHYEARRLLEGGHSDPDSLVLWPVHYAARDAMACAAVAMVDKQGVRALPTVEEMRAAKEARKEQERLDAIARDEAREAARVERERKEGERLERLEAWRMAFESLEARADLSNVERAGLEAVRLLLPLPSG